MEVMQTDEAENTVKQLCAEASAQRDNPLQSIEVETMHPIAE